MILGLDVARSLAGPFLVSCALLAISGAGKVVRPAPAAIAVNAAGLRIPRSGVVVVGLVELGLGVGGSVFGGQVAYAVAAGYALLTVFAVRLLRRAPTTPCACLGSANAVVTRTHVAINVAAVGIAIVVAPAGAPLAQISGRWFAGAVFMALVACCVKLATLTLEALPELATATKEGTT